MSVNSASIPHADSNQGPRIVYQCQMGKQASAVYATNHAYRMDTTATIFLDAQLPLVASLIDEFTGLRDMPGGTNVYVGILPYTGFNIEDSIMVNKRSIENGLLDVFVYKVSELGEYNE